MDGKIVYLGHEGTIYQHSTVEILDAAWPVPHVSDPTDHSSTSGAIQEDSSLRTRLEVCSRHPFAFLCQTLRSANNLTLPLMYRVIVATHVAPCSRSARKT